MYKGKEIFLKESILYDVIYTNNNEDNTNICNKNTPVHNSISIFVTLLIYKFVD